MKIVHHKFLNPSLNLEAYFFAVNLRPALQTPVYHHRRLRKPANIHINYNNLFILHKNDD